MHKCRNQQNVSINRLCSTYSESTFCPKNWITCDSSTALVPSMTPPVGSLDDRTGILMVGTIPICLANKILVLPCLDLSLTGSFSSLQLVRLFNPSLVFLGRGLLLIFMGSTLHAHHQPTQPMPWLVCLPFGITPITLYLLFGLCHTRHTHRPYRPNNHLTRLVRIMPPPHPREPFPHPYINALDPDPIYILFSSQSTGRDRRI